MSSTRSNPWASPLAGYAALGLTLVVLIVISFGRRLPYMELDATEAVRTVIVFLFLYVPLVYFMYFKRLRRSGKSIFRNHLDGLGGGKRAWLHGIGAHAGALLICGGLAAHSFAFPAVATQLFAHQPYEAAYTLVRMKRWGVPTMYRLHLLDTHGRALTVNTKPAEVDPHWATGGKLRISGRTWALGTLVESVTSDGPDP